MLEVKPYCWECPACNISFRVPYLKSGPEADVRSFDVATSSFLHLLVMTSQYSMIWNSFEIISKMLLDYRGSLFGSTLEG